MKKVFLFLLIMFVTLQIYSFNAEEKISALYPGAKIIIESEKAVFRIQNESGHKLAFITSEFTQVKGYAGAVVLAVITDEKVEELLDLHIIDHMETPAFMRMVEKAGLIEKMKGAKVADLKSGEPIVDTVSGATFTSKAIIQGVRDTLMNAEKPVAKKGISIADLILPGATLFVLLFILVAVLTRKQILRYIGFALYLGFFPVFLGRLLSLEYVIKFIQAPGFLTPMAFLVIFVIVFSFFKNRPYCYNMCPVGLFSQLGCRVKSKKCTFKDNRGLRLISFLLFNILYLLGFVYFLVFPFQAFVSPYTLLKVGMIVGFAVASVFLPYIWCNNLCPLGTLFSIQFDLGRIVKGAFKKKGK